MGEGTGDRGNRSLETAPTLGIGVISLYDRIPKRDGASGTADIPVG